MFKIKILRLLLTAKDLLNLKDDFDEDGCSEAIRMNSDFRSGNAWGLIFAIFIASIGLQVNSTAVIIGAMLISPLMGPIIGAGFSLGTHNFELLKKSLIHLGYAVTISIVTSTLFFILSPTAIAQSELIARTQPTFFDVMIAFFGGAAGIVASSRKVKSNAIPGVAIATALMPPLCTVGYGLANLEPQFIFGALYLFMINITFIFTATYLFVRFMEFKIFVDRNPSRDKKIHRWMTVATSIIMIPSLIMAWYLQKKTSFEGKGHIFIEKELVFADTLIAQKNLIFDISRSKIIVKVLGEEISAAEVARLQNTLSEKYDLSDVDLVIQPLQQENLKVADLEKRFVTKADLFKAKEQELAQQRNTILAKVHTAKTKLDEVFPAAISNVTLLENEIHIFWKKRPVISKQKKAEQIVINTLKNDLPTVSHSFE